jgi:large subunit ribosomal protein L13
MAEFIFDAKEKRLGRIASEAAVILQGKKSPKYNPRLEGEDSVLIKNTSQLKLSGRKEEQKIFYRHTGYMGHLKEARFKEAFAKNPVRVVRETIRKMLPKNRLLKKRLARLKIEK